VYPAWRSIKLAEWRIASSSSTRWTILLFMTLVSFG
jgi:hypothetical protein